MRAFALTLTMGIVAATAAWADPGPGWNGPGWYIVMDSPIKNQALFRGAYATEDACNAARPADRGSITYECVMLDHEPMDN